MSEPRWGLFTHKTNKRVRYWARRADHIDEPNAMPERMEIRAVSNAAFEREGKPPNLCFPAGTVDADAFRRFYVESF